MPSFASQVYAARVFAKAYRAAMRRPGAGSVPPGAVVRREVERLRAAADDLKHPRGAVNLVGWPRTPAGALLRLDVSAEDLREIRRRAQIIVSHRDDPCEYWRGAGCEVSMVHDAEDILKIVDRLLGEQDA